MLCISEMGYGHMDIKIGIGIPTIGQIRTETTRSLMEIMKLPYEMIPIFVYGAYVSQNREKIVTKAQELGCTHLLFIDHDMIFTPSDIQTLLSYDKPLVVAAYHERELPSRLMMEMLDTEDFSDYTIPNELFKIKSAGLGCSLIKMELFERLERPYFPMKYTQAGIVAESEDVGFCRKVREGGEDVWCDPTLPIKHIGDYIY